MKAIIERTLGKAAVNVVCSKDGELSYLGMILLEFMK